MASQNDNPFKRMKKALKGAKPSGEMVHKMAIKSVKMMGKKKVTKPDMMAMKKKRSTLGSKDVERKASKKGVTGMKGNVKRKAFGSMENGGQPMNAIKSIAKAPMGKKPNASAGGIKAGFKPSNMPLKVNISPSQGWNNSAGQPLKKKSKAKKK